MILQSATKILEWRTVEPIFKFYLSVWSNHIPLNWAILAWQCLYKEGLTVFNNDEEEIKIRSYAVALSLIYYEYCHRTAFSNSEGFNLWDDHILKTFKVDFLPDLEKDDEIIFRVKNCLLAQTKEMEMSAELWINCAESKQGFVFSISEKAMLYQKLVGDLYLLNDFNYEQGDTFIRGVQINDISNYVSISGL